MKARKQGTEIIGASGQLVCCALLSSLAWSMGIRQAIYIAMSTLCHLCLSSKAFEALCSCYCFSSGLNKNTGIDISQGCVCVFCVLTLEFRSLWQMFLEWRYVIPLQMSQASSTFSLQHSEMSLLAKSSSRQPPLTYCVYTHTHTP